MSGNTVCDSDGMQTKRHLLGVHAAYDTCHIHLDFVWDEHGERDSSRGVTSVEITRHESSDRTKHFNQLLVVLETHKVLTQIVVALCGACEGMEQKQLWRWL